MVHVTLNLDRHNGTTINLVNIMDGHYRPLSILYGPANCKWMPSLSNTVQIYITNLD